MASENLHQSFKDSYTSLGLGGQGTRLNSSKKESPPFISLSTDGLGTGSIRIEGFDKTNRGTLYRSADILEHISEILENGGSLSDIEGLSSVSLSPTEEQELNDFDTGKLGQPQGQPTNQPAGIKVPGLSDLPLFLKTLSQMLSLNDKANTYYYPLAPGKFWYLGAQGVSFTGDNASYQLIQNRSSNNVLTVVKLSEGEDGSGPLPLEADQSWPKPLSNEFLQTFPGLRSYANNARNLIDPEKLGAWATPGWSALNGQSPLYKNIMGSTDTLFLSSPENKTLYINNLSINLASNRTYTLSFYAKVLGSTSVLANFRPDTPYDDPANLTSRSRLVSVSAGNLYNPVCYIEATGQKEALFYSWKRYYFTFEKTSENSAILKFNVPGQIVETCGWLLEEANHPSPYDFRFLDCRSSYNSETQRSKDPGQSCLYPLLYLLPTPTSSLTPIHQAGTLIYRQYMEDKTFTDDHLCSLGVTDGKYVTWGLKGNKAGIWYGDTEIVAETIPMQGLLPQREHWLTNIITFSLRNNKLFLTWDIYGRNPAQALVSIETEDGIDIGQSSFGHCSMSSQHTESSVLKWSFVHFNLALGCELKSGSEPVDPDPFNQYFSSAETGFYNFSGDVFSDLMFCPVVLTSDQILKLTSETLVLKDQMYLTDAGNINSAETVMTLITSPIEQGHIQLSEITQAYVDNLSS